MMQHRTYIALVIVLFSQSMNAMEWKSPKARRKKSQSTQKLPELATLRAVQSGEQPQSTPPTSPTSKRKSLVRRVSEIFLKSHNTPSMENNLSAPESQKGQGLRRSFSESHIVDRRLLPYVLQSKARKDDGLRSAIKNGQHDRVALLLPLFDTLNFKSTEGETPLDIARKNLANARRNESVQELEAACTMVELLLYKPNNTGTGMLSVRASIPDAQMGAIHEELRECYAFILSKKQGVQE